MKPVVKGTAFSLFHVPYLMSSYGNIPYYEKEFRPESEYLKNLVLSLRSYDEAVSYPPNQVFIGNLPPTELNKISRPWHDNLLLSAKREGEFGEIFPEEEFYIWLKIADSFDLVWLSNEFIAQIKEKVLNHPLIQPSDQKDIGEGKSLEDINKVVSDGAAIGLWLGDRLIGCVKNGHAYDENLKGYPILEKLANKATSIIVLRQLIKKSGLSPSDIDFILESSEEAVGDMFQPGGGDLAKAIAEKAFCVNANGMDVRAFCAGPAGAMVIATSLVKSGICKNVVVLGGGSVPKLGMNSKEHVAKGMKPLEDCLGAVAVLVSENDEASPVIRTDSIGRHKIGTGSSPQAITTALVLEPLRKASLKFSDIDVYAPELHNPDITEPAGAGDVPLANLKMIAALAVMQGEIKKEDINSFIVERGVMGFAPTQGHIPSGIPIMGWARKELMAGNIKKVMVIGKGSLFLARMTNQAEGFSFIIEQNLPEKVDLPTEDECLTEIQTPTFEKNKVVKIGITLSDSEFGPQEIIKGAERASRENSLIQVVLIGENNHDSELPFIPVIGGLREEHKKMDQLLDSGQLDGAVTLHYDFPLGVTTVGKAITPGKGNEVFISSTTGFSAVNRVEAMIFNAIFGTAVAKAQGRKVPTLGIVNVEGSRLVEKALSELIANGYSVGLGTSLRKDGGMVLRGNDILAGSTDVMICDSLTGNILIKMYSAFLTGGSYEGIGYGYGPAVGKGYVRRIAIISRASGAPVIKGAIEDLFQNIKGGYLSFLEKEIELAEKAGLNEIIKKYSSRSLEPKGEDLKIVVTPKPCDEEIPGIDVLMIDTAVELLLKEGIYSEPCMGCTGPAVRVNKEDKEVAYSTLKAKGLI